MRENATLHRSYPNVKHLGISNVCFHTAAGVKVECLECIDKLVWDTVKCQYFPE